jgi:hypothetical protein
VSVTLLFTQTATIATHLAPEQRLRTPPARAPVILVRNAGCNGMLGFNNMKTSSNKDIQQLYDETAGSYNLIMDAEIQLPIYSDILSRLSVRISQLPGTVIDVACGSGHMLHMYNSQCDSVRTLQPGACHSRARYN